MTPVDPASIKIRPASSAIILRDGADGIEVFMVVRHHQIDFGLDQLARHHGLQARVLRHDLLGHRHAHE